MPIYAYKCGACGFAKDALQKMSDAPLTVCPSCGASAFSKQLTAAGFQLKGSGWYVTDFRDGKKGAEGGKKSEGGDAAPAAGADSAAAPAADPATSKPAAVAPASAPAAAAPAPASSGGSSD
ncbi:zinc ribbon domain-containing protein [Variovorax sp. J22P168]|uniref:FmdB family zinc ribbon protein n=1 Tax=Variovorax jilinensis TaxID=3053513 RepID=UPI002578B8D2|nr:FmdB family zinc ribbon protein [Variovorax sp. J22P168]MDM0011486.1 zinc ribbon domain-containing protein [Variovorax sp. J22P168]